MSARERMVRLRLSAEENALLEAVAAHYGLNVSSTIRMLVKRDGMELGVDVPVSPVRLVREA